jgi:hypothetical protein
MGDVRGEGPRPAARPRPRVRMRIGPPNHAPTSGPQTVRQREANCAVCCTPEELCCLLYTRAQTQAQETHVWFTRAQTIDQETPSQRRCTSTGRLRPPEKSRPVSERAIPMGSMLGSLGACIFRGHRAAVSRASTPESAQGPWAAGPGPVETGPSATWHCRRRQPGHGHGGQMRIGGGEGAIAEHWARLRLSDGAPAWARGDAWIFECRKPKARARAMDRRRRHSAGGADATTTTSIP